MAPAELSNGTRMESALELDEYLSAYESAAVGGENPDLGAYLPPRGHPLYGAVLRELIRVDLEFAWSRGTHRPVEEYRARFPEVFADPAAVRELAHEEYRLRKAAGIEPNEREFRERFGIDFGGCSSEDLHPTRVVDGIHPAWPDDRTPTIGDTIPPGYHLTGELGRGSFGRVFLAREIGLGGRPVAVKLSEQLAGEPLTLARLQHTNIVPIYAAHHIGRYTAVVMPYLGPTTLADVIASFRAGRLPQSGNDLASTLGACARSTAADCAVNPGDSEPEAAAGQSRTALDALNRMTFVEAVLWIGAELADGLAHAHDRGVLHRDIKPANVLFTDDGRPMLLDFNLAAIGTGRVCGTPRYMAPEQLAAAVANQGLASPQTDLYALGLVLLELLSGRSPFSEPGGRWEEVLPKMIAERKIPPVETVRLPKDVTAGVRSILAKCLDPDPARRYATAADLRDDLNRQRNNLPLKFAAEWSVRERVRKWSRRHPRLSSGSAIAAAAVVVLGLVTAGFLARQRHLDRLEAESARNELREAREFTQSVSPISAEREWREVMDRSLIALAPYRVETDDWVRGSLVSRLPESARYELRRDAAELMFKVSASSVQLASLPGVDPSRLDEAIEWNRRARNAYPGSPPRPFLAQQARLLRTAGRIEAAEEASRSLLDAAEPAPDDRAALGFAALESGRYREASEHLRAATQDRASRYSVWMGLAAAELRLARSGNAIDALSAASALRPGSPWPYFHRGIARLESKDFAAAIADFDRFLHVMPDDPDGLLNRAIARLLSHDARGAVADLDLAERLGSTRTRLFALRAQAKQQLGDRAGADRDRAACLKSTPQDPLSWCARAELKIGADSPGALADFDAALELDPGLLNALVGKASVLSENLGRAAEAIRVLDRLLELTPDSVSDRAGRAVLLARVGRIPEARREIETCAARASSAIVFYQLASAALIAGDKARGIEILRIALRKDPSLGALMPADPDLKSVWKDPGFQNLIAAAGTLSAR